MVRQWKLLNTVLPEKFEKFFFAISFELCGVSNHYNSCIVEMEKVFGVHFELCGVQIFCLSK